MYQQHDKTEGRHGWGRGAEGRHHHGHRPDGAHHGHPGREHHQRFTQNRAPVSIYKTKDTYEVLVFAPGRVKENFEVKVIGTELVIRYQPTDDTSSLDWVRKEYSRGGFERSFLVDEAIETENIQARYEDGVLKLSLLIKPGSEPVTQEVKVS